MVLKSKTLHLVLDLTAISICTGCTKNTDTTLMPRYSTTARDTKLKFDQRHEWSTGTLRTKFHSNRPPPAATTRFNLSRHTPIESRTTVIGSFSHSRINVRFISSKLRCCFALTIGTIHKSSFNSKRFHQFHNFWCWNTALVVLLNHYPIINFWKPHPWIFSEDTALHELKILRTTP